MPQDHTVAKRRGERSIDREKLVLRHNPTLRAPVPGSPLSVGNGEFTFTADITGLQSFREEYRYFPLCTMAQWGWHSFPVDLDASKLRLTQFDTYGRRVGYAVDATGQRELYDNLRENAHRLNLASIGLLAERDGTRAELRDVQCPEQVLDMWRGLLTSEFTVFGRHVRVETCADPEQDAMSSRVASPLAGSASLSVEIAFPYGSPEKNASDWSNEAGHKSDIISLSENRAIIKRTLDDDVYYADIAFLPGTRLERTGAHRFLLSASGKDTEIAFTCRFTHKPEALPPFDFNQTRLRAQEHWKRFWMSGGALQLINSSDPRAKELERRLVLSQYLTAIQCCGTVPPAETGLTCNSWYGKFHLEMHYWHAAHFPLWGRPELLERSLPWYAGILPGAREIAASQGYTGARWPKMCDAGGSNSPSPIAVLLIWQQPHPIMLAELCYRARPCLSTLDKYFELVAESAEFMVSFAHYETGRDRYVLGPPLIPAQETHAPSACLNPAYELEYFRWGLETANKWLQRLGRPASERYAEVARKLSPLPLKDGVYLAHENCPDTFTRAPFFHDHPSMLAAFGVLPGPTVDRGVMRSTVERVLERWKFASMWGWDFAMLAMCCARLGLPSLAVDMLLSDAAKNTYAVNGHNSQADRDDLPLYLPGNGGLLLAAGMMAAGWDGDGGVSAPGFPRDGSWTVEAEGLNRYI